MTAGSRRGPCEPKQVDRMDRMGCMGRMGLSTGTRAWAVTGTAIFPYNEPQSFIAELWVAWLQLQHC